MLVGITPTGTIFFLSEAYVGRPSDVFITRDKFLDLIDPRDVIMADGGFPMQGDLMLRQATLKIPPAVKGKWPMKMWKNQETKSTYSCWTCHKSFDSVWNTNWCTTTYTFAECRFHFDWVCSSKQHTTRSWFLKFVSKLLYSLTVTLSLVLSFTVVFLFWFKFMPRMVLTLKCTICYFVQCRPWCLKQGAAT